MDWRGRQDAGEIMSYAWFEEGYGDYQDYSYQAQAYQQEPSFQEHEFQPWDSNYQPEEVASNQPSQDFDIKAMLQAIMENQEMGQREMEKRFKQIQSQIDQVTSTVEYLEGQMAAFTKAKDDSKTGDILEGEMHEKTALVAEEDEHEILNADTNSFEKMLDEDEEMVVEELSKQEVTELPKDEASTTEVLKGSAHDESWSELKAPELELNPLPKGLRYAFLGTDSTHPVIINDVCDDEVRWLLVELSGHRNAIGFSLDDIHGISHSLCIHHTYLEEESRIFIGLQNDLTPNHASYCFFSGIALPNLCRLLWWLTLLLLALLVQTKLKLFPG